MLDVRGLRKVAAAQLTIDESTAVGVAQPETAAARLGFWTTGVGVFVLWNATTLVGAVVGDAMGDPRRYGLDAAAAAAFCALLWPRLKSRDAFAIAVLAAVIAVLVAPHAPAGVPVLVAACTALLAGWSNRAHHDPRRRTSGLTPTGPRPRADRTGADRTPRHEHLDRPAHRLRAGLRAQVPRLRRAGVLARRRAHDPDHLGAAHRPAGRPRRGADPDVRQRDDHARLARRSRGVAIVALLLRAPFIVVVVLGAAVAAGLRLLGLP